MSNSEIIAAAERLIDAGGRVQDAMGGGKRTDIVADALAVARAYLNPWRPITSAPRDGTRVLLWETRDGRDEWYVGWFEPRCGEWLAYGMPQRQPTHWTTLPPPPAPAA